MRAAGATIAAVTLLASPDSRRGWAADELVPKAQAYARDLEIHLDACGSDIVRAAP